MSVTIESAAHSLRERHRGTAEPRVAVGTAYPTEMCALSWCDKTADLTAYVGSGAGDDYRCHLALALCTEHAGGLQPEYGPDGVDALWVQLVQPEAVPE